MLLVDDNFMNNVSMQAALEEIGVASDATISGQNGIEKLIERIEQLKSISSTALMYKLIIVDYSMPEMDGIEFTQQAKQLISDSFLPMPYICCCSAIAGELMMRN